MEKNTNTEIAAVNAASQSIALQHEADLNLAKFLNDSENLDNLQEQIILTSQGISLEKVGEYFNGIFWGFSTMTVKDQATEEIKEIPAAQFLINKQIRMNAGVTLVKQLQQINPTKGTPLRVTFSEKDGQVKIYSVSLLG
jgi:hypothetical protein